MRSSLLYSAVFAAGLTSAAPVPQSDFSPNNVYFPFKDGTNFPNPDQNGIQTIQKLAHGTLPNAPGPQKLSPDGITSLKLVALNELSEAAFFAELVYNVTNKLPGYDLGYGHDYVVDALKAIVAQEEIHLINANSALKAFGADPIQPCHYNFPVTNFQDAILLAQTFTDLVLGVLQDLNTKFAQSGDIPLIGGVSATLGNEAEQVGFFRLVQKKRPSAQPFLTYAGRDFAFTALQGFTIPGSCPNINTIPLKTFKPLSLDSTNIKPVTQNLNFSFAQSDLGSIQTSNLKLIFINGQNVPIVKSLDNLKTANGRVSFTGAFGYAENIMDGMTLGAVVQGNGPFPDITSVINNCVFGPALIELNDSVMSS